MQFSRFVAVFPSQGLAREQDRAHSPAAFMIRTIARRPGPSPLKSEIFLVHRWHPSGNLLASLYTNEASTWCEAIISERLPTAFH